MRIVIVGAGIGGIAATIELQRHGFSDITVLEAAPEPGGTWFHNSYPGAACDVPSPLYSFSYAQRGDWTHMCAPQASILEYVQDVAREHGVDRRLVHGAKVTACTWGDALAQWDVTCEDGRRFEADAVIIATGQLHQPARRRCPGSTTSPVTPSTPPSGTTTTTWPASAWRSSAAARAPCSSCRRSRRRWRR